MGWLRVVEGRNVGAGFDLGRGTVSLGRDPANFIQIVDDSVSRRHLEVRWEDGGYRIVDLDSFNGTLVNGERVRSAMLEQGDRITVGETVFVFDDAERAWGENFAQRGKVVGRALREERTRMGRVGDVVGADPATEYRARRRQEARGVITRLVTLHDGGETPARLLEEALCGVVASLDPDAAAALVWRPDEAKLVVWAMQEKGDRVSAPDAENILWPLVDRVVRERAPVLMNDPPARLLEAYASPDDAPHSAACAPLVAGTTLHGALYADVHDRATPAFEPADVEFMADCAGLVTKAIAASRK